LVMITKEEEKEYSALLALTKIAYA
jgi:hypothetical protein